MKAVPVADPNLRKRELNIMTDEIPSALKPINYEPEKVDLIKIEEGHFIKPYSNTRLTRHFKIMILELIKMKNSFWGYKRKNGLVGIRNKLLIISITGLTGPNKRKISDFLKGSLFVDNPYGGGIIGEDKTRQNNAIIGFAENPNVGAVLIISADPPKGDFIKSQLVKSSKPIELLTLDECNHDAIKLLELGLRKGAKLIREISRLRREKVFFLNYQLVLNVVGQIQVQVWLQIH